ncbi:translocation/assembly module TamB domain-containing protein [Maricaulis sp. MIT060901]|uniref:translocation/assembly module TamB domain-containing protein n=1 Tax=Maricaulis sp. MIT060901 TaxID=3096993 RepID=UPI003999A32F
MQAIRDLSKNRWLRRGAMALGGVLLAGLVSLGLLTQVPGRALVRAVLDGREMGELGRLEVEGVRGNVLARFKIDRLTLSDVGGEWLVLENVRGDWDSLSALFRPLIIEEITAAHVSVLRRPQRSSQAAAGASSGGLPDLDLRNAVLENLVIAPGVAGPGGRYAVRGQARLVNGDVVALDFSGQGLSDREDHIALALHRDAAGLQGTIRMDVPGGSPIAHMMRLPGRAVSVRADLTGEFEAGRGAFSVEADEVGLASGALDWTETVWSSDTSINLARWPILGAATGEALQLVQLTADGTLGELDLTRATLLADGLEASALREGEGWRLSARVDGEVAAEFLPPELRLASAGFEGRVERRPRAQFTGEMTLSGLEHTQAVISDLSGPVELSRDDGEFRLESRLAASGLVLAEPVLAGLIGDELQIELQAQSSGNTYRLDRLLLETNAAQITANGAYEDGQTRFSALLELPDAGRLYQDLSGSLSANITGESSEMFTIQIAADQVVWPEASLGFLDGLTAGAQLRREAEVWWLDNGELNGRAVDLDISAQLGASGDWSVALAGAAGLANLAGPIGGSGVLALNLEAGSDAGQISLDAGLAASEIRIGETRLAGPELVIQSSLDDEGAVLARWGLRGQLSDQALELSGTADLNASGAALNLTDGRWGAITASGRGELQGEALAIQLVASDVGRFDATLDYTGQTADLFAGQMEARLETPARLIPGGSLSAAEITLSGPLQAMTLNSELSGQLGTDFVLDLPGELSLTPEGLAGRLSLAGVWGEAAIRTETPIRLLAGPLQARGRVLMGAGVLDLVLSPQQIDVVASEIPADLVGYTRGLPDLSGEVAARLQLVNADGHWQGDGELSIRDLTSRHDDTAPVLQVGAELEIDGRNRLDLQVEGDALVVRILAEEAEGALGGEIAVHGEIAPLARLLLPATADLSGQVEASLELGGRVEVPTVNGHASLHRGRVLSGTYGSSFADIEIVTEFAGDRLRVETLEMSDGAHGRASGQGEFRLDAETGYRGEARLEMTRMRLLSLPDLDMTLSGQTLVSADATGWLVSGQSRIDELHVTPGNDTAEAIPNPVVTEINLPDGRARSDYVGPEVRLDYRVTSEEGVRVAGTGFDSEWSVELVLSGRLSRPRVSGNATLKGGEAYLLSRPFDLTRGQVNLDGRLTTARVEIDARHQRSDLTVEARIAGSVDAPELMLSSTPQLPQDEILSRLLFGRDATELSAFETAQIAAQLSGYSMFNMINELRDRAGVDRLRITSNADGTIAVTGGHQISDDVYLEVETVGLSALATTRVEWSLTPDLSLLSRISDDTDASVSLRWRREFD